MSKVPVNPASGFRDFLPKEAAARLQLVQLISQIYQSHGFQPIMVPVLENLSTLQGKGGGSDNEKLIFKVLKRGDELKRALAAPETELADLGLRFDLTLPLARYCARFREELPKPFKVFQIGPVWRADRPQKGRYREFFQCDVDIIGAKEIGAEADCICAILEVFQAVGMKEIELHLNDRQLLAGWGAKLGADSKAWAEVLVVLDKLDKVGIAGVEKELSEKALLPPETRARFLKEIQAAQEKNLAAFQEIHAPAWAGLNALANLLADLAPETKIVLNPTLVRGQDYYTGTIFEIRHPALSGSLGGGGRYNRLLEIFGSPETPAFGGSIGFERLVLLLEEKAGEAGVSSSQPDLLFPLFSEEMRAEIFTLAAYLRSKGLRVDIFPDAAKLKNQFKYADDRKIPFVAIMGPDEAKQRVVKVKNMASGEESSYSIEPLELFSETMVKLCKR